MNQSFLISCFMLTLFTGFVSCDKNGMVSCNPKAEINIVQPPPQKESKMKITIGTTTFTATLYDNPTAAAFKSMLPLTLDMIELNRNEKYADLPKGLPTHASNPGTIQNGDLMLYGASTLVIFYKTFNTSYSYTKLGRVDDVTGLAAALGVGNVRVGFEME